MLASTLKSSFIKNQALINSHWNIDETLASINLIDGTIPLRESTTLRQAIVKVLNLICIAFIWKHSFVIMNNNQTSIFSCIYISCNTPTILKELRLKFLKQLLPLNLKQISITDFKYTVNLIIIIVVSEFFLYNILSFQDNLNFK
ncbi:Uncharacterised protein r2_g3961 [Pycnogonum litorale]